MQTLHIRAEHSTIDILMKTINQISKDGQDVEILDNTVYNEEQKMILKALIEEKENLVFEHDKLWEELLK